MPRSASTIGRAALGIGVSLVALILAVRGVDLERTAGILAAAAPAWIGFMLGCNLLDVSIRALRWQRLVSPIHRVAYRPMLAYLLVGYLANNVLPARLGELVRSHYLGDREGISRTMTLGTVVVERVIDTTAVVLIAAAAILVLHVRGSVATAVVVGLAVSGALVGGLAVAIVAHRLPGADRAVAVIGRWPQATALAARLREGLAVAARPRTVAAALVLTVGAWGVSVLAFAAAGQAVGVQLALSQAALMSAGVALATAIPSGPGYLGTFELAAVGIAETFGVSSGVAFAIALVVHAGILSVTSIGGAIALVRLGWGRSPGPASAPAGPVDPVREG